MKERSKEDSYKSEGVPEIQEPATNEYVQEETQTVPKDEGAVETDIDMDTSSIKDDLKTIGREKSLINSDNVGVVVNIVVALFTTLLFFQTKRANEISSKAVDESKRANDFAIKAYHEQRESDLKMQFLDSIAYENSKQKDSLTINIALKSLENQVNTLVDNRTKFSLENRAFLQVIIPPLDTTNLRDPLIYFDCMIVNTGTFPATVLNKRSGTLLAYTSLSLDSIINTAAHDASWKKEPQKSFLSKNGTILVGVAMNGFSKSVYDYFMKGELSIYMFVELEYFTMGIGKKYNSITGVSISRIPSLNKLEYKFLNSDKELK